MFNLGRIASLPNKNIGCAAKFEVQQTMNNFYSKYVHCILILNMICCLSEIWTELDFRQCYILTPTFYAIDTLQVSCIFFFITHIFSKEKRIKWVPVLCDSH